jgi:hypothetical protein
MRNYLLGSIAVICTLIAASALADTPAVAPTTCARWDTQIVRQRVRNNGGSSVQSIPEGWEPVGAAFLRTEGLAGDEVWGVVARKCAAH